MNNKMHNTIQALKRIQSALLKGTRWIRQFITGLINFVSFNISPVGLIIWGAILVIWVSTSFFLVFGKIDFTAKCDNYSIPNLADYAKEDKDDIIAGYLISETNISQKIISYIVLLAERFDYNNLYTNITPPPQNSELKDYSEGAFGMFRFKGRYAEILGELADKKEVSWTNENVQLEVMSLFLKNELNLNGIGTINSEFTKQNPDLYKVSDIINSKLGFNLSIEEQKQFIKDSVAKRATINEEVVQCVSMGTGKSKSRLNKGGARDYNKGLVDTSSLIAYLESVHEENRDNLYVDSGTLCQDISKMIDEHPQLLEAKDLANEVGEVDFEFDGLPILASCDRAVAMALKATGLDTEFTWAFVDNQLEYMKNNGYQKVWSEGEGFPNLIDNAYIVFWETPPKGSECYDIMKGNGHIAIIYNVEGTWKVYQASYMNYMPHKGNWYSDLASAGLDDCRIMSYWSFPYDVE